MDQVKEIGGILWTYRFWIAVGIAAILAIVTIPTGSQQLYAKAEMIKKQLDTSFQGIQTYATGTHANPDAEEIAKEKTAEVEQEVDQLWSKLYEEQAAQMTWPQPLEDALKNDGQPAFQGRPFGSSLRDRQGRYLFRYTDLVREDQPALELLRLLDPLRVEDDGKIEGTVACNPDIFRGPANLEREIQNDEAWLLQERFWVQRAVVQAIRDLNDEVLAKAKADQPEDSEDDASRRDEETEAAIFNWSHAAIRRLEGISVGPQALDHQTEQKGATLVDYEGQQAQTGGTGMGGGSSSAMGGAMAPGMREAGGFRMPRRQNAGPTMEKARYLKVEEQYRILPVSVSMLVDQRHLAMVLEAVSNCGFHAVIKQVNLKRERPELPGIIADGRAENDALNQSLLVDVWGTMRFYRMPTSQREAYEKKMSGEAEDSPGEPGDAEGAAEATPAEASMPAEAAPATPPDGTPEATPTPETPAEPAAKAEEPEKAAAPTDAADGAAPTGEEPPPQPETPEKAAAPADGNPTDAPAKAAESADDASSPAEPAEPKAE